MGEAGEEKDHTEINGRKREEKEGGKSLSRVGTLWHRKNHNNISKGILNNIYMVWQSWNMLLFHPDQ